MLWITTLVAIVLGISVKAPGVGVFLVIIAVPALIRSHVLLHHAREGGQPASSKEKVLLFLTCLGISALVALATGAAFFVTCLVGFFGGTGASENYGLGLILGVLFGSITGLSIFVVLIRAWFKTPARGESAPRYPTEIPLAEQPEEGDP
jgi:hypothetical protein